MRGVKSGVTLLLCALFVLAGCVPVQTIPSGEGTDQGGILVGVPPDATATWTPFQPLSESQSEDGDPGSAQATLTPPEETQATQAEGNPPTISGTEQPVPGISPPADTTEPMPEPPAGSLTVWVDPHLPTALREALNHPPQLTMWAHPNAHLQLKPGDGKVLSRWVYALVAPFPTLTDGVAMEELRAHWRGAPSGSSAGRPLLVDESTYHVFSALWGESDRGAVQILPAGALLDHAWSQQPSWGIVPFEQLDPRWKVLEVDGQSPLRKDYDANAYPLSVPVSIHGDEPAVETVLALFGPGSDAPLVPATNRDPQRLTVLAMTGVTALVRATAYTMEQRGLLYPGEDVRDWLRNADLAHISNEVPFANNCPYPNPVQEEVRFCSDPRYIALLEDVGTDIVELTGDHFADWGTQAMYDTLEMYRSRGWAYYGGGEDLDEARKAITIEHNGNRLAFIGCNAKGGSFAQAAADYPGAAACNMEWLLEEIVRLRSEGYLPIVTFQHFEYYTYQAQQPQLRDFRAVAEAGAMIVSGSQAHQPQGLEFNNDALIHYGLGNLFFDQYEVSFPTRQGFIDRHIFYNGKHIATELLTILFIDYARPRAMTTQERSDLLEAVFNASGW